MIKKIPFNELMRNIMKLINTIKQFFRIIPSVINLYKR